MRSDSTAALAKLRCFFIAAAFLNRPPKVAIVQFGDNTLDGNGRTIVTDSEIMDKYTRHLLVRRVFHEYHPTFYHNTSHTKIGSHEFVRIQDKS